MHATHLIRHRSWWGGLLDLLGSVSHERFERIAPSSDAGSWHWLYVDRSGVAVSGPRASFSDQDAAEAWVEANNRPLRGLGITAVTLRDGEHVVYGPTSV